MIGFNLKNYTLDNVVDFFERALKGYSILYYTYNYDYELYECVSKSVVNNEYFDFEIFIQFDKYECVYKVYIKAFNKEVK